MHFKISYVKNAEEYPAYKDEVPDLKKSNTDGGIVIKIDKCKALAGDIKIEFYGKHMMRKKKLFSFWFNTYFVNEKCDAGNFFLFFFSSFIHTNCKRKSNSTIDML